MDGIGQPDGAAFSCTSRLVALVSRKKITVIELATSTVIHEIECGEIIPKCIAFFPDSQRVITGNEDSTLLVWDIGRRSRDKPSSSQIKALWNQLASGQAKVAYRALWQMASSRDEAVALLCRNMRPVAPASQDEMKRLIRNLEDDSFSVREKASSGLARLGFAAETSLSAALQTTRSAEVRKRIIRLQGQLKAMTRSPEYLQQLRASSCLSMWLHPRRRRC